MQIEKAKATAKVTCKRCNGKGGRDSWHPDMGRCWGGCNGTGLRDANFVGSNITAGGLVAREGQLKRGTAPVKEILFIETETPSTGEYRLSVYSFRLDDSIHYWTTTDKKKGAEAQFRGMQALQREMTSERVAALVTGLALVPGFKAEVA